MKIRGQLLETCLHSPNNLLGAVFDGGSDRSEATREGHDGVNIARKWSLGLNERVVHWMGVVGSLTELAKVEVRAYNALITSSYNWKLTHATHSRVKH